MASLRCGCTFLQSFSRIRNLNALNRTSPQRYLTISNSRCKEDKSADLPSMEMQRTKINFVTRKTEQGTFSPAFVFKYSNQGFQIDANKVIGPVALFRNCYFSWKVNSYKDITPESLTLFTLTEPRIEILVIGVGSKTVPMPLEVKKFARENKLSLEVLDTPNACATYNFLIEEGRMVAAALIPPVDMPL